MNLRRAVIRRELVQRPLRAQTRAALATGRIKHGSVTIVIVNWNSHRFLETTLFAIDRFSDGDVQVVVVDNHSTDGSRRIRRSFPGIRWIPLPFNVGHELAMDIGFLLARTEYVIALDVDAFPISKGWTDRLIGPLEGGYDVAGAHVRAGFVHPCCLAIRLDRFVSQQHSFMSRRGQRWAVDATDKSAPGWDTGWRISLREDRRFLIDRTEVLGPGDIGSSWAGLVYHNFYSTRFGSKVPPPSEEIGFGVTEDAAADAWHKAVERYISGP